MSTHTLSTMPPELLLQIISHLPSSNHFLSLSQTSRSWRTFFSTHASTICNTHITTYHLAAASILLSINHASGWLIPTHPCVLAEERRILRDKILFSGCSCYSCRVYLLSSRTASSSGSSLTLSEMTLSHEGGLFGCIPRTPTATTYCKAQKAIAETVKLTETGPHYLVFLEKYGRDIEIRNSMRSNHKRCISETGTIEITQEEKEKSRFDFMVGNYSVRRFLEDVEREMDSFTTHLQHYPEDEEEVYEMKDWKRRGWRQIKNSVKNKMKGCFGRKKKYQEIPIPQDVEAPKMKRPLMFGEIEKVEFDFDIAPRRESWVRGLLWYHEPKNTPTPEPEPQITSSSRHMQPSKAIARMRQAQEGIRGTATRAKTRLGHVLRKMRCGEGFQSLDD